MNLRKTAFLLILSACGAVNYARAEIKKEVSVESYSVEFENFQWYKRIFMKIKGYDFLDWEELQITTTKEYDTETGNRAITGVAITNDENKKVFEIEKTGDKYKGLVDVDGPDEFTEQMTKIFLNIWNYFYDQRKDNLEISEEKIVKDGEDATTSFKCSMKKELRDSKIIISTIPPDEKKKYSGIETTMSNPENPVLEKIAFKVSQGYGITLTRKTSAD